MLTNSLSIEYPLLERAQLDWTSQVRRHSINNVVLVLLVAFAAGYCFAKTDGEINSTAAGMHNSGHYQGVYGRFGRH